MSKDFFTYLQFLFFKQWTALREYIHSLGIQIIGDLPIYVAMDSADVWAEPFLECLQRLAVPVKAPAVRFPENQKTGVVDFSVVHIAGLRSPVEQKYWQLLPLGPTSYGDSPYQSFSTFAGNPYFIDLDRRMSWSGQSSQPVMPKCFLTAMNRA